jgi:hypothetical protein
VGDLAVSLLNRKHTILRDPGRQAVDGRLG